jgi:hypothetical protein
MYRILAAVLCLAILSGCESFRERLRENDERAAAQQAQQGAAYREQLAAGCENIGFKRGTDAHANCVLSQHQQNMQLLGNAALMERQQQQQRQQQQEAARQRARTPPPTYNTNCSQDGFGNTNCTTRQY